MGNFAGHVIPALLFLVYGFLLHLHSIHTYHLLADPHEYAQALLQSSAALDLLSSSSSSSSSSPSSSSTTTLSKPSPSLVTRALLHRRLRWSAYWAAVLLGVALIPIEMAHWNGSWMAMASPQHATMYGLVVLSAAIGLCMDAELLSPTARVLMAPSFWLTSLMFAGHAQAGEYNRQIHLILAYLVFVAGSFYALYAWALATSTAFAAALLPHSSHTATTAAAQQTGSSAAASNAVSPALLLSFLRCSTSTLCRLTSTAVCLSGSWMLHIAFKLFSPFTFTPSHGASAASTSMPGSHSAGGGGGAIGMEIEHGGTSLDAETHTLFLTLSWHFLAVVGITLLVEVAVRYLLGEWQWTDIGAEWRTDRQGGSRKWSVRSSRSYEPLDDETNASANAAGHSDNEEGEEGELRGDGDNRPPSARVTRDEC